MMIVSGIDIGLLILAALQSGTGPAQDHLAKGEPTRMHTKFESTLTYHFCIVEDNCLHVCTCRLSARRCSSLWGRASRGDSAPSDSSRI